MTGNDYGRYQGARSGDDTAEGHRSHGPGTAAVDWPRALAFWVVVSAVGWLVVAGLVVALSIGDVDQIAIEKEEGEVEIAPASGPDGEAE